jgi:gas vesicle protein
MIRKMKHAVRWVAVGAAAAYLFDPERGTDRRNALRKQALDLIDRTKGSVGQLRSDADHVLEPVDTSASTAPDNGRTASSAATS